MKHMRSATMAFLLLTATRAAASEWYLWDGFEHEILWKTEEGAALERVVPDEDATEGTRSLRLPFRANSPSARAQWSREEQMDWSPYGKLRLDVFNPGEVATLRMSVVIITGENEAGHEAFLPPLAQGWNRDVEVNLLAGNFISAASNYQPRGYLVRRNDVQEVVLRVYAGAEATGAVLVDNVRLVRTGLIVSGDFAINPVIEATASGIRLGYVPPDVRVRRSDLRPVQSFDEDTPWTPDPADVTVGPATDHVSAGRRALAVEFPAAPDGFEIEMTGVEATLAGSGLFRMDVYNPGKSVSIALILEDNDGNEIESDRVSLGHGWNTPVWDLTNPRRWNGGTPTPQMLANLASVRLSIASSTPGRLVFDGPAAGSVRMSSAGRGSAAFRTSYSPSPDFEVVVTPRVEDTFYGTSLAGARDAGAEATLDSAGIRADLGAFRTTVSYRQKVRAFDNPINALVNPKSLGLEVAAVESRGRIGDTEMQAIAASRLEYGRYNSTIPTGLGPEALVGARVRREVANGVRAGVTWLEHTARYGRGVEGIPRRRMTSGLDFEASMEHGNASLGLAVEGAMTTGDRWESATIVPGDDRYYGGVSVWPSWGRASLSVAYVLLGHDFDADFTKKGGNTEMLSGSAGLSLDGLPGIRALSAVPFTGGTLGNNLAIEASAYTYRTRDRILDPLTGKEHPLSEGRSVEAVLTNDYQARPNVSAGVVVNEFDDIWTRTPGLETSLGMRVPLPANVVATLSGRWNTSRTYDLVSEESGKDESRTLSASLEEDFPSNLVVSGGVDFIRSRSSWEGEWGETSRHVRWRAGASKPVGAQAFVRLDYGAAPLYGTDYGSQDTLDVWTLSFTASF